MTDKKHDKHRYVRVVIDGQRCTMEPGPALETLIQQEGCTAEDVWLTRAEFEALPEFQGVVR